MARIASSSERLPTPRSEEVVRQRRRRRVTLSLCADVPLVDVHIEPSNDPPQGMGEPGPPPLASAFANAIAKLTGRRLREMPFRMT
jgi:isoquinoline 1-oxidoreductase subunit beta